MLALPQHFWLCMAGLGCGVIGPAAPQEAALAGPQSVFEAQGGLRHDMQRWRQR